MGGTPNFQRTTLEGPHKEEVVLSGSFRPDGSSDPSVIRGNWIDSVAHTATGHWTVTMKEDYRYMAGLHAALFSLRVPSEDLSICKGGPIDLDAGTVEVFVATESGGTLAAADIASDPDAWIDIELRPKYGTTPDGSGIV